MLFGRFEINESESAVLTSIFCDMDFIKVVILLVANLFFYDVKAQHASLSGKWLLSYRMPDGKEVMELAIQSNDSLAVATSSIGKFEILIKNKKITWSYPLSFKDENELASFEGAIKNDNYLKGIFLIHHGVFSGRAVKWKAHRISTEGNNTVE